jgi:hypothetical protein
MTREEGREYRRRWELVAEAEAEELRNTPPAVKLRQLDVLMHTARRLGWIDQLREGDAAVREQWIRLRRALLG